MPPRLDGGHPLLPWSLAPPTVSPPLGSPLPTRAPSVAHPQAALAHFPPIATAATPQPQPESPPPPPRASSSLNPLAPLALAGPHLIPDHDTNNDLEAAKHGKYGYLVQNLPCSTTRASSPLRPVLASLKCQPCVSKSPGSSCAFAGLRSFPLSKGGTPLPFPVFRDADPLPSNDDPPHFPTSFNAPFTPPIAAHLKSTAAAHLPPTLRAELAHALLPSAAHRHDPSRSWTPLSRIPAAELRRLIDAMERWTADHPPGEEKGWVRLPPEWLDAHRVGSGEKEEGRRYLRFDAGVVPPRLDDDGDDEGEGAEAARGAQREPQGVRASRRRRRRRAAPCPALDDDEVEREPAVPTSAERALLAAGGAGTLPPHASLSLPAAVHPLSQLALFRALWSQGEPLVVDLSPVPVPSRPSPSSTGPAPSPDPPSAATAPAATSTSGTPRLAWTPALLARRYGHQRCSVGSNDWPAAEDFKDEYPDLWHDQFMDVLPAGSLTRRDGVLNLSAHTPLNACPPDLGPKGYFSEISCDDEGGQGSTKLHKDVADAVNVLLWASDAPDGGPGVAIWDLYRAEDADKVRDFLYGHVARLEGWKDADEARRRVDDPIHTQRFFLTRPLRAALLASHGVRSFRIHQRPGQAVLVPAGCAHQVMNAADCIKVATDFVSAENVARCWKVTDEFRAQTKDKVLWRSDVLQLKSMLLWAWYSAERFDRAPGGAGVKMEDEVEVSSSGANGAKGVAGAAAKDDAMDVDAV
ncbi:hypothetical protein DMC30DRAFT_444664 [Rhodotorula diobovata]|uniref:JmjC domain-containing protein n=1 Tax=Rhodotorula diobovata TaxID=5288 RepID=A0A5C5G1X5_9BASI|nr:hypothetical protein DMC30DRAFT_444664 [Rhodotorula diobovata]